MNRERSVEKDKLEKNIDELRAVLNKICISAKSTKELEERLVVSERLDKLIVEYMNRERINI